MSITLTTTYDYRHGQKLTPYQRQTIALMVAVDGAPQVYVAELFGVSRQTVSKISLGSWQTTRVSRVRGVTA